MKPVRQISIKTKMRLLREVKYLTILKSKRSLRPIQPWPARLTKSNLSLAWPAGRPAPACLMSRYIVTRSGGTK